MASPDAVLQGGWCHRGHGKVLTGERSLTWRGREEAGTILPTSGASLGPHVCQALVSRPEES